MKKDIRYSFLVNSIQFQKVFSAYYGIGMEVKII